MARKYTSVKKSFAGIRGSTVINHALRIQMAITLQEYVILDFIYNFEKKNKRPFERAKDEELMYREIGTRPLIAMSLINNSSAIDYFEVMPTTADNFEQVKITEKWSKLFEDQFLDEFENLWELYGKVGNKNLAKNAFIKTIKEVSIDYLISCLKLYDEHLKSPKYSYKDKMQMSTWLNPINKRFNDELEIKVNKEDFSYGPS